MAKNYKDFDDSDGVWRTVGGRRIFIRNGQDLASAMVESGKFKNLRTTYKKDKESKNISSKEMANELQNADIGDWNNMNQQERDEVCKDILDKTEEKYGDKLKDDKFRKEVTDKLTDENFHTMSKVIEEKYGSSEKLSKSDKDLLNYIKGEDRERQIIARDIAKELDPSLKNASETLLDKRASELMAYNDGEVLEKGEKPYTNRFGELERSTKSLKEWRDRLKENKEANKSAGQKTADLIKESGVKTFADEIKEREQNKIDKDEKYGNDKSFDMRKYDVQVEHDNGKATISVVASDEETAKKMVMKSENAPESAIKNVKDNGSILDNDKKTDDIMNKAIREKAGSKYYEGTKRWGFGYANDDNIPVYQNKIDYSGDFTHANLSKVSNDDLVKIANKQNELYNEATSRQVGDRRTYNGKKDQIFKDTETLRYGNGLDIVSKEMEQRGLKPDNQITNTLKQKAYQKYLKEHPNSNLTFNEFKDMRK